jgi:hypothetical protein
MRTCIQLLDRHEDETYANINDDRSREPVRMDFIAGHAFLRARRKGNGNLLRLRALPALFYGDSGPARAIDPTRSVNVKLNQVFLMPMSS